MINSALQSPNEVVYDAIQVEYKDMASWYDTFWQSYTHQTLIEPLNQVTALGAADEKPITSNLLQWPTVHLEERNRGMNNKFPWNRTMKNVLKNYDDEGSIVDPKICEKAYRYVSFSFFPAKTEDTKSLIGRNPQKVGYCRLSLQLLINVEDKIASTFPTNIIPIWIHVKFPVEKITAAAPAGGWITPHLTMIPIAAAMASDWRSHSSTSR